jgi:hypothetical protein
MDSSVYTFVEDLRGEGAAQLLDRVLGYGCTSLTVAAAYHQARDVTPHGPSRVTLRGDGVHFPPGELFGRRCLWQGEVTGHPLGLGSRRAQFGQQA